MIITHPQRIWIQPKVRSQRSIFRAHTASAKPVNRAFAIQENAVQHVTVGASKDDPVHDLRHY